MTRRANTPRQNAHRMPDQERVGQRGTATLVRKAGCRLSASDLHGALVLVCREHASFCPGAVGDAWLP